MSSGMSARQWVAPPLARHGGLALGAAVALVALSAVVGAFTDYNLAAIAYFAVAAAGLSVLTGLNGQLSLGHGALMAVGAYTTSLLETHHPLPVAAVLSATITTATLAGLFPTRGSSHLQGPFLAA